LHIWQFFIIILKITKFGRVVQMGLQIDVQGRILIASPEGELDHLQAERLRGQIDSVFEKSSCKHLVFNMEDVRFMDSSGIGMIIGRYKNAEKRGGQLVLANMNDAVTRLFEVSGLAKIILRTKTVKDAFIALGGIHSER